MHTKRVDPVVFLLCAVAAAMGFLAVRHSRQLPASPTPAALIKPFEHSERLPMSDRWLGSRDGPITLVEFADFQCPFCAQFVSVLDSAAREHHDSLSVNFRHLPLRQIHPLAYAAAVAAECGAAQDRFGAMYRVLYRMQSELTDSIWHRAATLAGVPNAKSFDACMRSRSGTAAVARDLALADSLGLTGTPSLIVRGRLINGSVSLRVLDSVIESAR